MITVALHIQNEVICEGLRRILEGNAEFSILDGSGKKHRKALPRVIITDVLPPSSKLNRKKQEPRLILWQDSKEYPAAVLGECVTAILDGGCAKEEILLAVRRAAEGKRFVSSSFAEILTAKDVSRRDTGNQKLSPREEEVLKKISAGHTLTSIAAEMNLSINTISTYQTRIIKKLGLKTSGELIRYTARKELGH